MRTLKLMLGIAGGIIIAVVVLVVACSFLISQAINESTKDEAKVVGDTSADVKNLALGQTAQVADSQITATAFRFSTDDPYQELQPGHAYAVVAITVKNTGKDTMSSFWERRLNLVDGQDHKYDRAFVSPVADSNALDGQVLPDSQVSGEAAFIVSADAQGLMLVVSETIGGDEARWRLQ